MSNHTTHFACSSPELDDVGFAKCCLCTDHACNPLPSELRRDVEDVIDGIPIRGNMVNPSFKLSVDKIVQLFNTEYQRRIKAAKPDRRTLPLPADTPLMTQRWKGFNKAIDQYEHNLKQLSEGGVQIVPPLEGESNG